MKSLTVNTILQCKECTCLYRIPVGIVEGMLPVWIECPECKHKSKYAEIKPTPKFEPTKDYKFCRIYGSEIIKDAVEEEQQQEETGEQASEKIEEIPAKPSLQTRIDCINQTAIATFTQIDSLREELKNIRDAFYADITREIQVHSKYLRINLHEYAKFVVNPLSTVGVYCSNQHTSMYAKYIMFPKFFEFNLGLDIPLGQLGDTASLQCKLTNQYLRLNFPLDNHTCGLLSVPANLDIQVHGNRIVGTGLKVLQQDRITAIPATVPDIDSSEDSPAYKITGSAARYWLSRHGMHAFSKSAIGHDRFFPRLVDLFTDQERQCFLKYIECGRLAVFSDTYAKLNPFVVKVLRVLKGKKFIIKQGQLSFAGCDDDVIREVQHDLVYIDSDGINKLRSYFSNSVIINNIILFADSLANTNARKLVNILLEFDNLNILAVSDDRIMDVYDKDVMASLLYTICPYSFDLTSDLNDNHDQETEVKKSRRTAREDQDFQRFEIWKILNGIRIRPETRPTKEPAPA